ncbi:MAG: GtrA family protein [Alphaproteobacteria bacterium]|nr:GtrA family protein [Alphaproteobacteria bacterium]
MAGNQVARFLLLGGLAALINWLVRFPLSEILPFESAVAFAYLIGVSAGFVLYRTFVFPGGTRPMGVQITMFLAVNGIGALVVLAVSLGMLALLAGLNRGLGEAIAHASGIGVGAIANFFGHKMITFAAGR